MPWTKWLQILLVLGEGPLLRQQWYLLGGCRIRCARLPLQAVERTQGTGMMWHDMTTWIVAFIFSSYNNASNQSLFRFWVSTLLSPQEWDSEGTPSSWSPPALTGPSRSMAAPKLQQLELFWEFFETQKHFAPLWLWIEWTVHFSEFKTVVIWTRNNNTTPGHVPVLRIRMYTAYPWKWSV